MSIPSPRSTPQYFCAIMGVFRPSHMLTTYLTFSSVYNRPLTNPFDTLYMSSQWKLIGGIDLNMIEVTKHSPS